MNILKTLKNVIEKIQEQLLPTPWPNQLIILMQGGLGNGDFGLIFGNPGGGKSWTLSSFRWSCCKLGYNVITLYLRIRRRICWKKI